MDRRLKLTLIILFIIFISLISFGGLYVQETKFAKNLISNYVLGMDFSGYRAVTIVPSTEKETIYYDKDGNVVDEEAEDGSKEEIPVNSEDILIQENFQRTKEIIEKRLYDLRTSQYLISVDEAPAKEYQIRLDNEDGTVVVHLPENLTTDLASQFIYTRGVFTVEDEEGQLLLTNTDIKNVLVGYNALTSSAEVYLRIQVNEGSVEKLKDMSKTYVESQDAEGKDTSKEVLVKIDGTSIQQTTFDNEITDGVWELTIAQATDNNSLNAYLEQASNIAILLNSGAIPVEYTVEQNRYIKSDLTLEDAIIPAIVIGAILVIGIIFLIVKYKKLGLLAAISYIGFLALFLLAARFFYLVITIEGIAGIIVGAILNYIALVYLLQSLSKADKNMAEYRTAFNKSIISMLLILIPTLIIGIALCCSTSIWLPAYSFGTVIFWGVFIIAVYNAIITRVLFLNSIKE